MSTEAQQRLERQSKALGAAFLAHQVHQLEHRVDSLSFSRDGTNRRRPAGTGGAASRPSTSSDADGASRRSHERETRVLDASVLVHALPVVKQWVREDKYHLVVPLAAISTLDVLKKAPAPLNELSRQATLFLTNQIAIAQKIQAQAGTALASTREGRRVVDRDVRLRAQRPDEELSWSEVEKAFRVPEGYVVDVPKDEHGQPIPRRQLDGEEAAESPYELPRPTANDIPRHLRSTLQCALFHLGGHSAYEPRPALVYKSGVAVPPPTPAALASLFPRPPPPPRPTADPTRSERTAPEPAYLALSSGDELDYYLRTFFPLPRSDPPKPNPADPTDRLVQELGSRVSERFKLELKPVVMDQTENVTREQVEAASKWFKDLAKAQQDARERRVDDRHGGGPRGEANGGTRGTGRGGATGPANAARGKGSRGGRGGRGGAKGGGAAREAENDGQAKRLFVP